MSSVAREKSRVSRASAKPNYVKRLQFDVSVPNSNVPSSSNVDADPLRSDANLLYTDNVAEISFGGKQEFVRQWIETHDGSVLDPVVDDDDISPHQSSPILGLSATKRVERSPVLGNSKKRPRGKAGFNCSAATESKVAHVSRFDFGERDAREDNLSSGDEAQSRSGCTRTHDVKRNIYRAMKAFDEQCSIKDENVSACNSPSLDKSYAYKRRKRKCREETKEESVLEDSMWIDTKLYKTSNTESSAHTRKSELYGSLAHKYPRIEETSVRNRRKEEYSESICILDINPPSCSQNKLEIVESPVSTKSSINLNIESCHGGDRKEYKDNLDISSSDSDKTITNVIEDVDSQDVIPIHRVPSIYRSSVLSASSNTLKSSIASTKDSDETFYSKAEEIIGKLSDAQTSQKISQTPSSSGVTQKSSQADIIISLCASPLKVTTDALTLNTLDSGKKRKKPKKGTIADRLQSLISRQISCIRIWRHQMKNRLMDNTSIQYVTVQVQMCSMHFGRQFLEGFIIEDTHNLLQDYFGTGTFVEAAVEPRECMNKKLYKGIAIMTVPSIIGTIQMRAEGIIRIYPPWEIIDNVKSIISVMYLRIAPPDESNAIVITNVFSKVKKPLVNQDFTCSCMEAGNFLASCEEHKEFNKPNPMMQLFKF